MHITRSLLISVQNKLTLWGLYSMIQWLTWLRLLKCHSNPKIKHKWHSYSLTTPPTQSHEDPLFMCWNLKNFFQKRSFRNIQKKGTNFPISLTSCWAADCVSRTHLPKKEKVPVGLPFLTHWHLSIANYWLWFATEALLEEAVRWSTYT